MCNKKNHPWRKQIVSTKFNTKLYVMRSNMMSACYNKKSKSYYSNGAKGIGVYGSWRVIPKTFYKWALSNGYKEGMRLQRIDKAKNFHPDNCKFVVIKTQLS